MLKEFLAFVKQYGVIGLAIAVVIGGKINELVKSLVDNLVMPLVDGHEEVKVPKRGAQ